MTHIVCYTGGSCGDIITALIDPRDAVFKGSAVMHHAHRQQLKKPHLFDGDAKRNQYLHNIGQQYLSVPSHDLEYHLRQAHDFITIAVTPSTALWAAERFRALHRPHVWHEMQQACGATSIEDYAQIMIDYSNMVRQHTKKVINLDYILDGSAADIVQSYTGQSPLGQDFYAQWLQLQT
jgi:hypothetical protein